jgi:hypothetical protein
MLFPVVLNGGLGERRRATRPHALKPEAREFSRILSVKINLVRPNLQFVQ